MDNRIEEQPYYNIFLDLIVHPYYATHQEEAQFTADFLHQRGYRKPSQLSPQPLDDKELREKAKLTDAEISLTIQFDRNINFGANYQELKHRAIANAATTKAFALLQPKIEEARRQEKEGIINKLERSQKVLEDCKKQDEYTKGYLLALKEIIQDIREGL